jgi:hypothetical protein
MRRPLQLLCPTCDAWCDAAGIADTWVCGCGAPLPEKLEMRGGRLDTLTRLLPLTPAGVG